MIFGNIPKSDLVVYIVNSKLIALNIRANIGCQLKNE